MSDIIEIDNFYVLIEELKEILANLNDLKIRIKFKIEQNPEWDSSNQVSLTRELLNIQTVVKSLCDDLMHNRVSDPIVVSIRLISSNNKYIFFKKKRM
jgi:hypothetical protein